MNEFGVIAIILLVCSIVTLCFAFSFRIGINPPPKVRHRYYSEPPYQPWTYIKLKKPKRKSRYKKDDPRSGFVKPPAPPPPPGSETDTGGQIHSFWNETAKPQGARTGEVTLDNIRMAPTLTKFFKKKKNRDALLGKGRTLLNVAKKKPTKKRPKKRVRSSGVYIGLKRKDKS